MKKYLILFMMFVTISVYGQEEEAFFKEVTGFDLNFSESYSSLTDRLKKGAESAYRVVVMDYDRKYYYDLATVFQFKEGIQNPLTGDYAWKETTVTPANGMIETVSVSMPCWGGAALALNNARNLATAHGMEWMGDRTSFLYRSGYYAVIGRIDYPNFVCSIAKAYPQKTDSQEVEERRSREREMKNKENMQAKNDVFVGSDAIGSGGTFSLNGRSLGAGGFPIPAYSAQEEGRIVVNISVDPQGNVMLARIGKGTTINSDAMRKSALEAARKTKFNRINGNDNQSGIITYLYRLH